MKQIHFNIVISIVITILIFSVGILGTQYYKTKGQYEQTTEELHRQNTALETKIERIESSWNTASNRIVRTTPNLTEIYNEDWSWFWPNRSRMFCSDIQQYYLMKNGTNLTPCWAEGYVALCDFESEELLHVVCFDLSGKNAKSIQWKPK